MNRVAAIRIVWNMNSRKVKQMRCRKSYLSSCVMILFIVMTLHFFTGSAIAADPEQLLSAMAKKIAEVKQFSVTMHMGYDVVQESGQKIEFSEIRKITIDRPNHIRSDVEQSDGGVSLFIFDGREITLFSAAENVYTQKDRPSDLDSAIRYAVGEMGIRVPLARILLTTFPADLKKLTVSLDYVEYNTLGTAPTNHIAGQLSNVDYQIWIAEDQLPRRIVMTYKDAPGQPQFWAEFSDWNLAPEISSKTFVFTPPKGAEKISLFLPTIKPEAADKAAGGS
jgi:hypothetical protein